MSNAHVEILKEYGQTPYILIGRFVEDSSALMIDLASSSLGRVRQEVLEALIAERKVLNVTEYGVEPSFDISKTRLEAVAKEDIGKLALIYVVKRYTRDGEAMGYLAVTVAGAMVKIGRLKAEQMTTLQEFGNYTFLNAKIVNKDGKDIIQGISHNIPNKELASSLQPARPLKTNVQDQIQKVWSSENDTPKPMEKEVDASSSVQDHAREVGGKENKKSTKPVQSWESSNAFSTPDVKVTHEVTDEGVEFLGKIISQRATNLIKLGVLVKKLKPNTVYRQGNFANGLNDFGKFIVRYHAEILYHDNPLLYTELLDDVTLLNTGSISPEKLDVLLQKLEGYIIFSTLLLDQDKPVTEIPNTLKVYDCMQLETDDMIISPYSHFAVEKRRNQSKKSKVYIRNLHEENYYLGYRLLEQKGNSPSAQYEYTRAKGTLKQFCSVRSEMIELPLNKKVVMEMKKAQKDFNFGFMYLRLPTSISGLAENDRVRSVDPLDLVHNLYRDFIPLRGQSSGAYIVQPEIGFKVNARKEEVAHMFGWSPDEVVREKNKLEPTLFYRGGSSGLRGRNELASISRILHASTMYGLDSTEDATSMLKEMTVGYFALLHGLAKRAYSSEQIDTRVRMVLLMALLPEDLGAKEELFNDIIESFDVMTTFGNCVAFREEVYKHPLKVEFLFLAETGGNFTLNSAANTDVSLNVSFIHDLTGYVPYEIAKVFNRYTHKQMPYMFSYAKVKDVTYNRSYREVLARNGCLKGVRLENNRRGYERLQRVEATIFTTIDWTDFNNGQVTAENLGDRYY